MTGRTLVLWCPDWPVIAAEIVDGVPAHGPVAVLHANRVLACSPAARSDGVRRGLRRREAQGRCPQLVIVEHDTGRDARAFEPVLAAVEEIFPGVEVIRPGVCALAAQGPSRYFGGAEPAAERAPPPRACRSGRGARAPDLLAGPRPAAQRAHRAATGADRPRRANGPARHGRASNASGHLGASYGLLFGRGAVWADRSSDFDTSARARAQARAGTVPGRRCLAGRRAPPPPTEHPATELTAVSLALARSY